MDNVRLLLVVALAFISLMLWEAWQRDYVVPAPAAVSAPDATPADTPPAPAMDAAPLDAPAMPADTPSVETSPSPASAPVPAEATLFTVQTDVLRLRISTAGGTIVQASLLGYPVSPDAPDEPVDLLTNNEARVFIYQGGIAGDENAPTHHALYTVEQSAFTLAEGADTLVVPLTWRGSDGREVVKRYTFTRGGYVVDVDYALVNDSSEPWRAYLYEQLQRTDESSRQGVVYTFTGAALSTPENRYEKFDLDDLQDQPIAVTAADGWVGVMQHYFVSALVPPAGQPHQFYSKTLNGDRYIVGFVSPPKDLAPGARDTLSSRTFIGPKTHELLRSTAPGLELAVDYGILWFIAKPLYVVLEFIHDVTGNWGWAIVILTLLLKLVFFPLSAAGYRSMANMRKVQPRMLALRDRYKDDKAQLNQAMMQLYKDEKINPLGGCLPILIQIPVFISLYWVLLESVEIRQAHFILWIQDLSAKDPYFVLPLLMGISMWGQQKLNPAPLDPMQAKVMQILPFVFTVFFAFFPSGLVLYWLVNNILSIAQQWQITRTIENQ